MVVTSVEKKHYELWQLDISIPEKHGCRRLYGENGGPGGFFHTMRQIPLLMEIARDVERLCPDAWLLNMSNPESRLCLALSRFTKVKNVGICLGAYITQNTMANVLGLKQNDVDIKVAGHQPLPLGDGHPPHRNRRGFVSRVPQAHRAVRSQLGAALARMPAPVRLLPRPRRYARGRIPGMGLEIPAPRANRLDFPRRPGRKRTRSAGGDPCPGYGARSTRRSKKYSTGC